MLALFCIFSSKLLLIELTWSLFCNNVGAHAAHLTAQIQTWRLRCSSAHNMTRHPGTAHGRH